MRREKERIGDETEKHRWDRNFSDLLQELRVAQAGVQILFAFLLTLPFSNGFTRTTQFQQKIYVVALLTAAFAAAMIIAPVAFHRALFRQGRKPELVRYAHRMATGGLAFLLVSMVSSILLITEYLLSPTMSVILTVVAGELVPALLGGHPVGPAQLDRRGRRAGGRAGQRRPEAFRPRRSELQLGERVHRCGVAVAPALRDVRAEPGELGRAAGRPGPAERAGPARRAGRVRRWPRRPGASSAAAAATSRTARGPAGRRPPTSARINATVVDDLLLLAAGVGQGPRRVGRAVERLDQLVADERHPADLAAGVREVVGDAGAGALQLLARHAQLEHHVVHPEGRPDPQIDPDDDERDR